MQTLGNVLNTIGSLVVLVCDILIIVKMFQRGQTGLGILGIVLTLCFCCPGILFTYIYGWVQSTAWNLKNVMIVYTVGAIVMFAGAAMAPPDYEAMRKQWEQQMHQQGK